MKPVEAHDELLNVYDETGRVLGARRRREAKASGLTVGAVNALVLNDHGELLLQRRPDDKENGGRWDKSVGGHVSAGESFDRTVVREAGEELFDDPHSPAVVLAGDPHEFAARRASLDLSRHVLLRPAALQLNLRDVRLGPDGGARHVFYHVGIYLGVTAVPLDAFRPQPEEIVALRYAVPAEVDRLLLDGRLAPNMAFLWLTQGSALLHLA